jgi:hypothetical protein
VAEHSIVRGRKAASRAATRAVSPWRRLRWTAIALGAATVLASCGTVPGAAVTIDGTAVSTLTVRDRVAEVVGVDAAADDDTLAAQSRAQLTTIIRHQLARAAAEKNGITVADADVNAYISQYDDYQRATAGAQDISAVLGVPADDVREAYYDLLVFDKLVASIPDDGMDVTDVDVTVDAVPAATWSDAVSARTKYLADPAAMDSDAAAALAANPQLPGGHESLLEQPQHAVFGIFSAAAGEILLVPQGSQGYLVVRITQRSEKPGKLTTEMISNAAQSAGLAGQIAIASLLLGPQAEAAHVELNPRFGVWDPRIVQVVASH